MAIQSGSERGPEWRIAIPINFEYGLGHLCQLLQASK
jgi:hypothetical protein